MEAYLTRFEWVMQVHQVPEDCWAAKLAPLLIGKAELVCAALNKKDAQVYTLVKDAILRGCAINPESYRQNFRSASKN